MSLKELVCSDGRLDGVAYGIEIEAGSTYRRIEAYQDLILGIVEEALDPVLWEARGIEVKYNRQGKDFGSTVSVMMNETSGDLIDALVQNDFRSSSAPKLRVRRFWISTMKAEAQIPQADEVEVYTLRQVVITKEGLSLTGEAGHLNQKFTIPMRSYGSLGTKVLEWPIVTLTERR